MIEWILEFTHDMVHDWMNVRNYIWYGACYGVSILEFTYDMVHAMAYDWINTRIYMKWNRIEWILEFTCDMVYVLLKIYPELGKGI